MRRFAIRLGLLLIALLVVSQLVIPPLVSRQVEKDLSVHGGHATVHLSAFPAIRLLFRHGTKFALTANGLSVDLGQNQSDVFKQLDQFSNVDIQMTDSRAGPFTIGAFRIKRTAPHTYALAVSGSAAAGDVARYAGARLGGGFGQALAGLAASALGDPTRPIPFDSRMQIDTLDGSPRASDVVGQVGGFPAGPLAQIVANALLSGL